MQQSKSAGRIFDRHFCFAAAPYYLSSWKILSAATLLVALIFAPMLHHFTPTGRISRWPYFWHILALYLLAFACYGLPTLAEYLFGTTAPLWKSLALIGMTLCFYLTFLQVVKRLHDLDLRAWWLLLFFLPGASLVLGAGMQFVAGTAGPNRFGPSPR